MDATAISVNKHEQGVVYFPSPLRGVVWGGGLVVAQNWLIIG
jgi:hypothetical protein